MKALLSDLWSLVLPIALSLCGTLILLAWLGRGVAKCYARKKETPTAALATRSLSLPLPLSFALPLAPVLLLLALWLSPQTAATTANLLARQSPDALLLLLLAAPLALLFLWGEGSSLSHNLGGNFGDTKETTTSETTPLERMVARIFGEPLSDSIAYKTMRFATMLFALCCLLSLLCDLVPTLAHFFVHQATRATMQVFSQTTDGNVRIVSALGMGLLLALALPQFFPQPNKAIAWILLLLLPSALLFYGALCLIATPQEALLSNIAAPPLPVATQSTLNADTLLATLGVFRPAFGWLALLCCVPYYTHSSTHDSARTSVADTQSKTRYKLATALILLLAFVCLLGFVGVTAAPIVASKAWLLGEPGLQSLRAAFLSHYPNEGWLLEASLAALSATTLLALAALTRAALTVLSQKAALYTLALLLPAATLGIALRVTSVFPDGEGASWQTSLLFAMRDAQAIGQLAQGVAILLFLTALSALAWRRLARLVAEVSRR